jgi:ketosteroid isomerase-like protein
MAYTLDELSSLAEIRQVQERYCRGIDRADPDILRSVYWEDATDDHGVFRGDREAYIAWVMPVLHERFAHVQHVLGQTYIELDGDTAHSETYFVQHSLRPDGRAYASPGRYVDRLERRNGEWRVADRVTLMTFFYPLEVADTEKLAASGFRPGTRDASDPGYFGRAAVV